MPDFFKAARWFLYAAVFAVIFVSARTLFPFIVLKYSFFRLMVDAAAVSFCLGVLLNRASLPAFWERARSAVRTPLFIAVSAFTGIVLIASAFAEDSAMAFWSNFERGEGGIQFVHLFLFFALAAILFSEERHWRTVFKSSLAAGGLIVFYGILAGLGVRPFIGPAFADGVRFQGSLGNAAYVGVYFLFALFYSLYLSLGSRTRNAYLTVAVISAFVVFFAQTRGPFFGLAAGIVVFLALLVFRSAVWRRRALVALAAFAVLGSVLFAFHTTAFVRQLPGARLFNLGFTTSSWESRLWVWRAGYEGFKERPLLGWGPENFSFVFDKYFDTRHYVPNVPSDTWYDRAHNIFIDYLVETGLLGLTAFLAVFASAFLAVKKARAHFERQWGAGSEKTFAASGLLAAMLVAYLVQGIVLFDILPTYLNLFLLLAFLVFLSLPPAARIQTAKSAPEIPRLVSMIAVFCGMCALLFGYAGGILPYTKARAYINFLRSSYEQRTIGSFTDGAAAVFAKPSPVGQSEIFRFLTNELAPVAQNQGVPVEAARYLVDFLEREFSAYAGDKKYATIPQQYLANGQLRLILASREGKKDDSDRAIAYFEECLAMSPNRPQCLIGLYKAYSLAGDKTNAEKAKQTILSFWPSESAVR